MVFQMIIIQFPEIISEVFPRPSVHYVLLYLYKQDQCL